MLDIDPATFHRAYNAVANSTLWFVHHLLYDTPDSAALRRRLPPGVGSPTELQRGVRRRARRGGRATGAKVLVQDYHLTLAAAAAARRCGPTCGSAHFSHTPWAPPTTSGCCPTTSAREVLLGMLGADHAGLPHRALGAAPSSTAARRCSGAGGPRSRTVTHAGRTTRIDVHALGVDAGRCGTAGPSPT